MKLHHCKRFFSHIAQTHKKIIVETNIMNVFRSITGRKLRVVEIIGTQDWNDILYMCMFTVKWLVLISECNLLQIQVC